MTIAAAVVETAGDGRDACAAAAAAAADGACPPGRVLGGRYRVERTLKRGLGVETLLARDLTLERDVVVKTAPAASLTAAASRRLEHEAEVLREVASPYLTPLADSGTDGDLVFLAVPFVPGVSLDERLKEGPLPARDALAVGRCLLAGLAEAHARGVLHRDVKPGNAIVDRGSPIERAVLIDFGLARSARLDASIRELPVGTVRYVSPEQAGLLARGVDERSDLYSVGATLYECLAGRPAFGGETVGEVLRGHLLARPPDTRSLGRKTPRALDEVVQRLIRIDPRDRYQSAAAALEDLDEIARALARGDEDPEVAVGAHDRRATLTEPAFIGRGEELAALDAEVARAGEGQGGVVLLEAPSGGGKTRLLDELARRAARRGVFVLRGQGTEKAAPRPFQILEGVVRELVAAARVEPGLAERVRERLGPDAEAACAAFPELLAVLGARSEAAALGLEAHGVVRSVRALGSLLDVLGARGRPALILLDDGQWADELMLRLLAEWEGGDGEGHGRERHVLLVVSFRTEEVPQGHGLRALGRARRLAVRPLDAEETRRLIESMAGPLPDEAAGTVARAAEGSPFLAAAVLQGMLETGALVAFEGGGWRVERSFLADVPLSRRAAVLLARRVDRLPAVALSLLSVGAVLGKEFDLDLATALAGVTLREAGAAVDEARRRQIVWTDAPRARCAFAHDRLREALLARLSDDERRRLHRLAAERIEARRDEDRVFDLAYHFDGAGEGARALPHAIAAAERARGRYALEVALRYYRIAERYSAAEDAATRLRILEGLADVLLLRGQYAEGAGRYEEARALCKDPAATAGIEGKLGQLEMKRGRNQVAILALERALGHLGRPLPETRAGLAVRLLGEGLVQVLHTFFARLFVGRRGLAAAGRDLLGVRLLKHLSLAYFLEGDALRSLHAHLLQLNLAERYPPTKELGQTYGEHGWVLAASERGRRYAERGAAICRAQGDLWGCARTLLSLGYSYCVAGRYREAKETLLEGERLFVRAGDPWEGNWDRVFRALTLLHAGELRACVELSRRGYASSVAIGDFFGSATYLWFMSRASPADVPPAWLAAERERPRHHAFHAKTVLQLVGEVALAEGRTDEAVAAFEEADRVLEKVGPRFDTVVRIPARLAAALRLEAASVPACDARRREALLDRAGRAARRGVRVARSFPNNLPGALREVALVEAARGRPERARTRLDESLAAALRRGQRHEQAMTLAAQAEVGRAHGWPGAAEDDAAARRLFEEIGAREAASSRGDAPASDGEAVTLSLVDRFANVLEVGRKIATALTREAVFAAVRDAVLALLRAERCEVVAVSEISGAVSRTALERTLAAGRPVVLAEGLAGLAEAESAVLEGVRSALCAPIVANGRPAAVFYVTHRQVGGLFGDDEARLAEFIAALAGAALENAAGVATNIRAEDEIRRLLEALGRGQEEERRRLALALHDGAGQLIAALGLKLDDAAAATGDGRGPPDPKPLGGREEKDLFSTSDCESAPRDAGRLESVTPPRRAPLRDARALVDQLGEEVRRIAHDLRPAALDRLGLAEALADLAQSFRSATLEVEARISLGEDAPPVPPDAAATLFRIAQQALANIARHARARRASVALERGPACFRLTVEDDGAGFDPAALPAGRGIGLVGMRERAAWAGGSFELDAAPGRGTRVRVQVPLGG